MLISEHSVLLINQVLLDEDELLAYNSAKIHGNFFPLTGDVLGKQYSGNL